MQHQVAKILIITLEFEAFNNELGVNGALGNRGVFGGGYATPAKVNTIDFITISTLGNAQDFGDLTTGMKIYNLKPKLAAGAYFQKQFNNYLVDVAQQTQIVKGTSIEKDWAVHNELIKTLNKLSKLIAKIYLTGYANNAKVYVQKDNSLFDNTFLQHLWCSQLTISQVTTSQKCNQAVTS